MVPFDPGVRHADCLDDIEGAKTIVRALGKDYLVVDQTDPSFGFPVVQVVIPGYSDILPYHPASSSVLFREWNRAEAMDQLNS